MGKPTNQEKNAEARKLVIAQLKERGLSSIQERAESKRTVLDVTTSQGHDFTVLVKSKSSKSWQIGLADGDPDRIRDNAVWVLVDRGNKEAPQFFVVPDRTLREGIRSHHAEFLEDHDGVRPETPDSPHHAIELEHVSMWKDRWDLLGAERVSR